MTRNALLFPTGAALLALAAGCGPTTRRENLAQFAVAAAATSDSSPDGVGYTAAQATGAPDVPSCGDDPNSWAPGNADPGSPGVSDDYIDLTYDRYVFVKEVDIFQSYNPGQIDEVDLMAEDGSTAPIILWQDAAGDPPDSINTTCPVAIDVFVLGLNDPAGTPDQYNQVRIYLDDDLVGDGDGNGSFLNDYPEIDSVQLVGDELVRR